MRRFDWSFSVVWEHRTMISICWILKYCKHFLRKDAPHSTDHFSRWMSSRKRLFWRVKQRSNTDFLRWEQKKCAAFPLIVFPIESIPRRLLRIVKHRNNLDNLCGLARKSRYKSLLEASRRDAHIINKINYNQEKKHRTSVQMLSNLVAKFIPNSCWSH